MPRTPDSFPGQRKDESILVESGSYTPTINGEIAYVSGTGFRFMDEGVLKQLSSTGITEASHAALRQLIHLADGNGPFENFVSGATLEIGPQPFPTASIWRTVDNKKIVQKTVTRNASQMPTTIIWQVFAVDGITVQATATDTITYVDTIYESGRTRTIT